MTHALYSNIPSVTKRKLKHPPLQLSNLIWPVLNTKIGYETHEPMTFGITEVKSLTCYIIRDNVNMNDIWKLQWWRLPIDTFLFSTNIVTGFKRLGIKNMSHMMYVMYWL